MTAGQEDAPAVAGRIDLHSHLLPDRDDGCQFLEESLECVRELMRHGFVGTVCTPHILRDLYPDNAPKQIETAARRLRKELKADGLDYQIWTGGEVRLAPDTVDWLEEVGVPSLAGSNHVLTDYFGRTWPYFGDEIFDYLFDRGYVPVLAHPERLALPPHECVKLLDRLTEAGIKLQGNLRCLTGVEGRQAQHLSTELLQQGRYWALAMDMHRPDGLAERFRGLTIAANLVGHEQLRTLVETNPRSILPQD